MSKTRDERERRILRSKAAGAARFVRAKFPEGTRVVSRVGSTGTVLTHVAQTNSLGGYLVVQWDEEFRPFGGDGIGRVNATTVEPIA